MSKEREVASVEVAGKLLSCSVCGGQRFWTRDAMLSGRALAFFDLEWAGQKATIHVCERCGHVDWFLPRG